MKTVELYICEHCGGEYRSKRIAAICEAATVPDAPAVKSGDLVFVYRDDYGWEEREVAEVYLECILSCTNGGVLDDADSVKHIAHLESLKHKHGWLIRVGMTPWWKNYPYDSDNFQSFPLDHVKLSADAKTALDGSTWLVSRNG